MILTISGPPGAGTSTVANILKDTLNFRLISAGEIFRQTAKEMNLTLPEFGSLCESNPQFDTDLDAKQIRYIRAEDDLILEGRLAGHNSVNAVNAFTEEKIIHRILLTAAPHIRAQRIVKREQKDYDQTLKQMIEREVSEKKRYAQYYQIDMDDSSIYDIVIPTDAKSPEEIAQIVLKHIGRYN